MMETKPEARRRDQNSPKKMTCAPTVWWVRLNPQQLVPVVFDYAQTTAGFAQAVLRYRGNGV